MARGRIALIDSECVACGACVSACPAGALSVYKGLRAIVDDDSCAGCGKCERRCPAGVIGMVTREGLPNG